MSECGSTQVEGEDTKKREIEGKEALKNRKKGRRLVRNIKTSFHFLLPQSCGDRRQQWIQGWNVEGFQPA